MPMKDINSSVEAIDSEAENILDAARARANEIFLEAKEEAKMILSSKMLMDEIKVECDKIINESRIQAEVKIVDSEKKASEISTSADKKIEEVVELIVSIITGRT